MGQKEGFLKRTKWPSSGGVEEREERDGKRRGRVGSKRGSFHRRPGAIIQYAGGRPERQLAGFRRRKMVDWGLRRR
jgi:hypothetical protein